MVRYKPGSFTKNFGWDRYPPGLSRLHQVIRLGFSAQLQRVTRDVFRQRSRIRDADRQLIPINFFLYNARAGGIDCIPVDELVFQAITQPHSASFDKLALFALHLSEVGARRSGTGHTHAARYLRDFVTERLWDGAGWKASQMNMTVIEPFLEQSIVAAPNSDTVHKCATNYLFMFRRLGLPVDGAGRFDLGEGWLESAMYLFFDRVSLDAGPLLLPDEAGLVAKVASEDLHKLLGLDAAVVQSSAKSAAKAYTAAGGLDRF